MTAWLTLLGLGEDGLDGLSKTATKALAEADLVVGGRRHLELVGPTRGERLPWASPIEATFPLILARRGSRVCVLASGDPFSYGIGSVLAHHVPPEEMVCHPQPSAFALAVARLGWGLQDCVTITLHGRPLERIVPHLRPEARILALSWDGETPLRLARLLCDRGFGDSRLTIFEAMGGPRERRRTSLASGFDLEDVMPLNTIALEVRAGPGARVRPLVPGLPDDWFEHDGQVTKSRIRAATLAALAPLPGQRLWDVGAGSGSVAIEWMLAHPHNGAVAIEARPDRAARIRRNATVLGTPDLQLVEGSAPAALAGLEAPHAIFIGGGLTAPALPETCIAALPHGGRLVVNAVTIESQALLVRLFGQHGGDLATLNIAEASPVGGFHGWRAAMPVVQWTWAKP